MLTRVASTGATDLYPLAGARSNNGSTIGKIREAHNFRVQDFGLDAAQLNDSLQGSTDTTVKVAFRRILNLLLYLSFCVMVGTGLLMAYRLIPGSRGGQGLEVLGWDRHEWGAFHTWVSYFFITLVAAHLAINWAWLTKCAAGGHAWRLGGGLLAGAAIIGAFLLLPISQRQGGTGKRHGISLLVSPASEFLRVSSAPNESSAFQTDISPVFQRSCFSCHGPEKQKAGFRADRLRDFFRDGGKGPLVVPGNSGESRLVAIVSGEIRMKRNASDHLLSAQEIALIKSWIDAGAQ